MRFTFPQLSVFVVFALGLLQAASLLHGGVIYVKKSGGNDSNDGSSWANSVQTLKKALELANDEIWMASGQYGDTVTDNNTDDTKTDEQADSMFTVSSAIKIYGGFNGTEASPDDRTWSGNKYSGHPSSATTIKGSSSIRPLYLKANVRLDGLTISGGTSVAGNGGGVYVKSGATFWKCKVQSNSSTGNGGGIYVKSGTVNFIWTQVISNTASGTSQGGGVYTEAGTFKAYNSTFQSNTAYQFAAGKFQGTPSFYCCLFKSSTTTGGNSAIGKSLEVVGGAQFHYCTFEESLGSTLYIVYSSGEPTFKGCLWTAASSGFKGTKHNDSVQGSSPASTVSTDALPTDLHDFDNDGNTVERLPVDLNGKVRNDDASDNFDNHGAISKEAATFTTYTVTVSGISTSPLFDEEAWDGIKVGSSSTTLKSFEAQIGESPVLKANPPTHWEFAGWNGDPSSLGDLTLPAVSAPVSVTASFTPIEYTATLLSPQTLITVGEQILDVSASYTAGESGTAEFDGGLQATTGSNPNLLTVTSISPEGYRLKDWIIKKTTSDNVETTVNASESNGEYNSTSPLVLSWEANWEITPVYTIAVYDLTIEESVTNYSDDTASFLASFGGTTGLVNGSQVTVEVKPSEGHQLEYVTITDASGQDLNHTALLDANGKTPVLNLSETTGEGTLTFALGGDMGYDVRIKGYFLPVSYLINVDAVIAQDVEPLDVLPGSEYTITKVEGDDPLPNGWWKEGTVLKLDANILSYATDPNKIEVTWEFEGTKTKEKTYYLTVDKALDITVSFNIDRYELKHRVFFDEGNATYVELKSQYLYDDNVSTAVEFDATGYEFNGTRFADDPDNLAPDSFIMRDDVILETRFLRKEHVVSVSGWTKDENGTLIPGGGDVAITPPGYKFDHDEPISLKAEPDTSYQFAYWLKDDNVTKWPTDLRSSDNPVSVDLTEPLTLKAVFEPRQYQFNFLSEPRSGGGWFAENVSFADGTTAFFTHGDVIEIQAAPAAGYDINGSITLVDFAGAPLSYQSHSGTTKRITLTVLSDANVSAVFSKDYGDYDGDGLDNYTESIYGSNLYLSDSDGDGMDDKWEITYGLNPIDPNDSQYDEDYDNLTNLHEYQSGTFPRNPDSNGDGIVDVYDPKDISVALQEGYFFVRIDVVPFGAGIVTGEGAYESNATASITLFKETPGYVFVNWQGDLSGSDRNGTVSIDSNKTIIANFAFDNRDSDGDGIDNYTEGLYGTDASKTDTDGDGMRDDVEIAALTAIADLNVTGVFDPNKSDSAFLSYLSGLNVSTGGAGADSNGSSLLYDFINGWFYTSAHGWSFAASSSSMVYNANMATWLSFQKDSNANFKILQWDKPTSQWVDYGNSSVSGHYSLTVTKNVSAGGEVSPSSSYPAGTNLQIEARANPGYKFIGWEGDVISSSPSVTFPINENTAVQAIFLTDEQVSSLLDGTQGN